MAKHNDDHEGSGNVEGDANTIERRSAVGDKRSPAVQSLDHLEDAWRDSPPPPKLDAYLPSPNDSRTLVELIKIDQEHRWSRQDPKRVEDYLGDWPHLADDRQAVLELLRAECLTRAVLGQPASKDEIRGRVPELADQVDLETINNQAHAEVHVEPTLCFIPDDGLAHTAAPALPDGDPVDALPEGHTILGRYRVIRLLGCGSMGAVYLADDLTLKSQVAVKIPNREQFVSTKGLDRFLEDDAQMGAQLRQDPGFVAVYDAGRDEDGTPFMVMQYVPGSSLAELLEKEKTLPPQRAAELLADVADALQYAHHLGLYHCDLKPDNILLDEGGQPKITDFGIAVHESVQRQHAGEIAGTPPYMSPEQFRGERQWLGGPTDIWSLGVILYESLTGTRPFSGKTYVDLGDEILNKEAKPLRVINGDIPERLEEICLKCLAKKIPDRYKTAADVARDLRRWLQPSSRRLVMLSVAAGVVALLAVGGLIGSIFWPGRQPLQSDTPAVTPQPLPRLSGNIDVLVYDPNNKARHGVPVSDPVALPLQPGDCVRIDARLNRPAYAYLVWIDSDGRASPVYPWTPGRWTPPPPNPLPRSDIRLPEPADEAWPMQGSKGMETVMLLARDEPLPADVDIESLFAGLPRQENQGTRSVVWFSDGEVLTRREDRTRGPQWYDPQQLDDPVLRTQRLIQERLAPHFDLIRANSFAFEGE